jgi:hypothetical protein
MSSIFHIFQFVIVNGSTNDTRISPQVTFECAHGQIVAHDQDDTRFYYYVTIFSNMFTYRFSSSDVHNMSYMDECLFCRDKLRFRQEEEIRIRQEEEIRFRQEEEIRFRQEEEIRFRQEEEYATGLNTPLLNFDNKPYRTSDGNILNINGYNVPYVVLNEHGIWIANTQNRKLYTNQNDRIATITIHQYQPYFKKYLKYKEKYLLLKQKLEK